MITPNAVTVAQAAGILGQTPQALYLAIKQGRVKSNFVLDRIVIPRGELNRLIKQKKKNQSSSNGNSTP